MPREFVPEDERAFRAFLSPRGFDDDVMAVAFHLYRSMQEAIARAEAEVLRPIGLSWVAYVTLMGLWHLGSAEVRTMIDAGAALADIAATWATAESEFVQSRRPFLLY